jgi:hypothetical protein
MTLKFGVKFFSTFIVRRNSGRGTTRPQGKHAIALPTSRSFVAALPHIFGKPPPQADELRRLQGRQESRRIAWHSRGARLKVALSRRSLRNSKLSYRGLWPAQSLAAHTTSRSPRTGAVSGASCGPRSSDGSPLGGLTPGMEGYILEL